jgi:hypothetical protein
MVSGDINQQFARLRLVAINNPGIAEHYRRA